jgi:DNA-binding IclR family transcriptional regulator
MTAVDEARGAGLRTLRLLQCLAEGEREFSLKELAQRAGLAPSTVHRLLALWVRHDMVERAGAKAYRLGPEIFRVASLLLQKFDVQRVAQPYLQELWTEWQETASLCLYRPASLSANVAASIRSPHPLQMVFEPLAEISLAWGSMGRAILAHLPRQDADTVLTQNRTGPLSGKPLPSRRKLQEELREIRQRGFALFEDKSLNMAGVSAPVFGQDGRILGCLAVTLPAARFRLPVRQGLPAAVMQRARDLSEAVGFKA